MKNSSVISIGIDDTDSINGMCTTYLAYKIAAFLKQEKVEFMDYPKLIRLNPNIPWKTRGNGSIALKIKTSDEYKIKRKIINLVTKFSDIDGGANPGIIFYNNHVPESFNKFSKLALWQLISRKYTRNFIISNNIDHFSLGNGQGLVGALSAVGYKFTDYTFELIGYRKKSKFGTQRKIALDNVKLIEQTHPSIFNSYYKNRILIAPRGPDPVFYGLRGENIASLIHASKLIKTEEKLDGYMIFKSNQGTSSHLENEINIFEFKPYLSGTVTGCISIAPVMQKGGHVIFSIIKNEKNVRCIVYKPTGITMVSMNLIKGDNIRVGGGIRRASKNHERVLNVELLEILKLSKDTKLTNPICTNCNKRMKSKGLGKGFRCNLCKIKSNNKITIEISRKIKLQSYVPIKSAHRHLTRPLQRIGIKNENKIFNNLASWFCIYKNN